jgi:hypothetical protein
MANPDNPVGFDVVGTLDGGAIKKSTGYLNSTQTIAVGDPLILSSGRVSVAAATSGSLLGVCAPQLGVTTLGVNVFTTPAQDTAILYYDARHVFAGQCSGTYANTYKDALCDVEGTTGIFEVNENATTESCIQIIDEITGNYRGRTGLTTGANSIVKFKIVKPMGGGQTADQTS